MRKWMFLGVGALLASIAFSTDALDRAKAFEAVDAYSELSPNDDIVVEDYVGFVQTPDLDGDGLDEILYLASSYCIGANFDCPNSIVVMTTLVPGETPPIQRRVDEWEARARRTGYAPDAGVQIPGEVMALSASGNRIDVTFVVKLDSPICKRHVSDLEGDRPTKHCPVPGRYRWAFEWTPGKLTRLADVGYEADVGTTPFPEPIRDTWVLAGYSCERVFDEDASRHITIDWDGLKDRDQVLLPRQVELLARTPWIWRVIAAPSGRTDEEAPAIHILSGENLTIADANGTRHYTRCRWQTLQAIKEQRKR